MTSKELAKLCHVSRATIDRVFNNRGKVNALTREYILNIAREVDYRPNYFAKSLVTGKSMTIGLLLPAMENSFFYSLFRAISHTAQQAGYTILVSLYEQQPGQEDECLAKLLDRHVDGILLFSTAKKLYGASLLRSKNVPTIALINQLDGFPCVTVNFHQAMTHAVHYVWSKGYRRLFFVCPPLEHEAICNMSAVLYRYHGFLNSIKKIGASDAAVLGSADYLEQIQNMSFDDDFKTAFLCSSDIFALKILKSLRTQGISNPSHVGVMGFDGIDTLHFIEPTLATVKIPIDILGCTAIQKLLGYIETGTPPTDASIPYSIQPGQSIV